MVVVSQEPKQNPNRLVESETRRCRMTQQATAETRYNYGHKCEAFPILYEDSRVQIFKNPSNEIFIEDIRSGATIRLSSYPHGGLQFTTDGLVEPIRITNTIGWRISPR